MSNKNPRSAYFSPKNWLYGSVSGLNGKRYSQQPVQDYEVNEDGTITAYGGTYNISTDAQGRKYFDVLIPEYNPKTKTGPYLNRGFDHINSSGRVVGRGETYNRYYVGNLIPIQKEVVVPSIVEESKSVYPSKQPSIVTAVKPKQNTTIQQPSAIPHEEQDDHYYFYDPKIEALHKYTNRLGQKDSYMMDNKHIDKATFDYYLDSLTNLYDVEKHENHVYKLGYTTDYNGKQYQQSSNSNWYTYKRKPTASIQSQQNTKKPKGLINRFFGFKYGGKLNYLNYINNVGRII